MEMEYAIIEASGRQFWVEPKKFIEFNRLLGMCLCYNKAVLEYSSVAQW